MSTGRDSYLSGEQEMGQAIHGIFQARVLERGAIAFSDLLYVEFQEAPPNSTVTLTSHRHAEKLPEVTGTSRWPPRAPGWEVDSRQPASPDSAASSTVPA